MIYTAATRLHSWISQFATKFAEHRTYLREYSAAEGAIGKSLAGRRERPYLNRKLPKRDHSSTVIYDSINDIAPEVWNAIIGADSLMRSHAYLSGVEQSNIEGCKYYYPVVHGADGAVAAHACVYVIDTDLSQILPSTLQRCVPLLRKIWPRFLIAKITECASPLSTKHSISIANTANRDEAIGQILTAIESIAKSERSRLLVIRDFLSADREDFDEILAHGYNLVSNMPLARIRIRWSTYDHYLESMRSRYRKDVKRRIRRAQLVGQTTRVLNEFGAHSKKWAAQSAAVCERTTAFRRETLPAAYYEEMDKKLAEKSQLVVALRDGEAVAHGMVLQDDETSIATFFGRDPGYPSQEWFHLANEVIRVAIERGAKYINLGLGSYDAKANIGADIEPLFVYSKSTISVVNLLMRLIPKTMDHPVTNPKRIFRDQNKP